MTNENKQSECEHEWNVYEVDDHDDDKGKANEVRLFLSLICVKCGAAARSDAILDYHDNIKSIDLSYCWKDEDDEETQRYRKEE